MAIITIIIPLYNKERQIERAIRSIQEQTFQDWHLIVVNDGSTDNGPHIVNAIEDNRIELIHQENAGPGAARNAGIAQVKTDYVSFLDADDRWHPEFLEVVLKAMRENDVAMVSTTVLTLPRNYDTGTILRNNHIAPGVFSFKGTENPEHVERILSVIIAINNLIRTDVIRKYDGFFDKKKCVFGEDRTLLWRIALNEPIMIVDRALAYYHTEDSELCPHTVARPFPPYLRDSRELTDYSPPSLRPLIINVLALVVFQYIHNQFRHASRLKLLWLLLRHHGTRKYPAQYYECLKRLTPGFITWQRIKKRISESRQAISREQMKIVFLLQSFPCLSETFILNQITGLIDLGGDVKIIAFNRLTDSKQHIAIERYKLLKRTRFLDIPKSKFMNRVKALTRLCSTLLYSPRNVIRLLKYQMEQPSGFSYRNLYLGLALIKEDCDIIHCHYGPIGQQGLLSKHIGLKAQVATVFHGYDLSVYLRQHSIDVYKKLFEQGDIFLPISHFWKQKLITLGCPEEKIVVNHMGIDPILFHAEKHRPPDTVIKILTLARLTEKKGHQYALEAIKQVLKTNDNIEYHLAGDGPLRDEIIAKIQNWAIEKNVVLHGKVSSTEAIDLYKNSDIFLLPSITSSNGDMEGIPVSLMEAMACGLPVITTTHSGIPELVTHQETGLLIPEKHVESLAEQIIRLTRNPELRESLGINAREFVASHFNTHHCCKETLNIFKSFLCK